MKSMIASGLFAGVVAGLVLGLADVVFASAFSLGAALISVCSSVAVAVPVSLSMRLLWGVLPAQLRLKRGWFIQRGEPGADLGGRILAAGVLILMGLAGTYHLVLFCTTSFKHTGLAALLCTVGLGAMSGVGIVLFFWFQTGFARILSAFAKRFPRAPLAFFSVSAVSAAFAGALVPPLLTGPAAKGLFGFVGLMRVDGLSLGPLLSVAVAVFLGIVAGMVFERKEGFRMQKATIAAVGAVFTASLATAAILPNSQPLMTAKLQSAGGVGTRFLAAGQRLTDKDGDRHGRLFGGRDCDDGNPMVYPGAAEVVDNGIDEDCSGEDLKVASLGKLASSVLEQPEPTNQEPLELPKDTSLLFITIDTVRWDAPGFMGYHRNVTPNMDRLAARGVVYDRAYSLSSFTCQSFPSIMTGKYSSELERNGEHHLRIGGSELFAAEAICPRGVRCKAIVSHFLFKKRSGWHQGFDDWEVIGMVPEGAQSTNDQYNAHLVADSAVKWLGKPENTRGRFWLWVHLMDPHRNYLTHKGVEEFGPERRDKYDHELKWTDMHLGRILDAFEKLDAAKRTVVVLTSDHGESFYEHDRCCHGYELWEENIRVPMVVTGPGISPRRIARPTSHVDLFPTFLDLFGLEIPGGTHGRSLITEWRADNPELPAMPILADQTRNEKYEARRVFIYQGYKLHHLPDKGAFRFFSLPETYEQGPSLPSEGSEEFARIQAAYRLYLAKKMTLRPAQDKVDVRAKTAAPLPMPRKVEMAHQ